LLRGMPAGLTLAPEALYNPQALQT